MKPLLAIHFARYGPYHFSRLRSAAAALNLAGWEAQGLETAGTDTTYAWDEAKGTTDDPRVITAFHGRVHETITAKECRKVLYPLLNKRAPDAIAIAGWSTPDALACLSWCRRNEVRCIVMSETREADGNRVWWKEWIKGRIIRRFDSALVGGRSHHDYLVRLGMKPEHITFGYNVVDNSYFAEEATKWRNAENHKSTQMCAGGGLPRPSSIELQNSGYNIQPFFLASNRFIERKNLVRLIDAYVAYIHSTSKIQTLRSHAWNLCLLGDGVLKDELVNHCKALGLRVVETAPWEFKTQNSKHNPLDRRSVVFFPGFRQIGELPRFYAHAGCFVHPALEEPWGLVINEAMACGLPILSGGNIGAAEELVDEGVNGWTFNAENVEEVSALMKRMSSMSDLQRATFGKASSRILQERCPTSAFGNGLAKLLEIE